MSYAREKCLRLKSCKLSGKWNVISYEAQKRPSPFLDALAPLLDYFTHLHVVILAMLPVLVVSFPSLKSSSFCVSSSPLGNARFQHARLPTRNELVSSSNSASATDHQSEEVPTCKIPIRQTWSFLSSFLKGPSTPILEREDFAFLYPI